MALAGEPEDFLLIFFIISFSKNSMHFQYILKTVIDKMNGYKEINSKSDYRKSNRKVCDYPDEKHIRAVCYVLHRFIERGLHL